MVQNQPVGQFVRVGDSVGVIVGAKPDEFIPEDHYAVWYGELAQDGVTPLAKTVPIEYCRVIDGYATYH